MFHEVFRLLLIILFCAWLDRKGMNGHQYRKVCASEQSAWDLRVARHHKWRGLRICKVIVFYWVRLIYVLVSLFLSKSFLVKFGWRNNLFWIWAHILFLFFGDCTAKWWKILEYIFIWLLFRWCKHLFYHCHGFYLLSPTKIMQEVRLSPECTLIESITLHGMMMEISFERLHVFEYVLWILLAYLLLIFYLYSRFIYWFTSYFPMIKDAELFLFRRIKIGLIDVNISGPKRFFVITFIILWGIGHTHFIILFVVVDLLEILIQFFSQLWSLLGVVSSLTWAI